MIVHAKRLFALACITTSTVMFAAASVLAAHDAAASLATYLQTLLGILGGGV